MDTRATTSGAWDEWIAHLVGDSRKPTDQAKIWLDAQAEHGEVRKKLCSDAGKGTPRNGELELASVPSVRLTARKQRVATIRQKAVKF